MKCRLCGAENPEDAVKCSVCMKRLDLPGGSPSESFKRTPEFHTRVHPMIPKSKTMLPTVAGAILIINALLSLLGLFITNAFINEFVPELSEAMAATTVVFGSLAVFALIGGLFAMMRRGWIISVIASVSSFFLVIPFGFVCGIVQAMLSFAALALLILSREEFGK